MATQVNGGAGNGNFRADNNAIDTDTVLSKFKR